MKKQFYRVAINIIPYMCSTISYTVAINESFECFLKRQSNNFQSAELVLCMPCTEKEYNFYKKYNPKHSYIKYKKEKLK